MEMVQVTPLRRTLASSPSFDTVGWASGRASGLYKNGGMVEVGSG